LTELPDTRLIAIASPIARPQPKTTAVMMPECAAGTITLKIVWICVAPSASDALFKCFGTALSDASLILMTVGRIMIARTRTADIRFAPPVN